MLQMYVMYGMAGFSMKGKCDLQGDPMQVKQKREMLLQEGVLFDSDTTIAAVCIITAADLERSYLKSQVVDD